MSRLASTKSLVRSLVTSEPGLDPRPRDDHDDSPGGNISPQERIKKVAARTMDLGRSFASRPRSPTLTLHPDSKRALSLKRKDAGKEAQAPQDQGQGPNHLTMPPQPDGPQTTDHAPSYVPTAPVPNDDSPFITPPSPTLVPARPLLQSFRDFGSMRAGTQTLIQALQALPLVDDPDDVDEPLARIDPHMDSDCVEEPTAARMASSIHAIYRPVARSRRKETLHSNFPGKMFPTQSGVNDVHHAEPDVNLTSDDDVDADDFEATTPRPVSSQEYSEATYISSSTVQFGPAMRRRAPSRAGSMTTVKVARRTRLAEKLKEIFVLEAIDEVLAEMPCWLLRSVLLQGYMYLTNSHLCFFAHMPSREDQILKSGTLSKRATRTKRWIKHWFVLKNDTLSWYQSSSNPYFLNGIVDLRYAISCDPTGEREIRLRTNQKSLLLAADSVPSREEWVKAIRKVIFKAQNMGDTVKIAIPYSVILEVDKSSAIEFSETIEIKVFDKEEHGLIDSYFFAYFHDIQDALERIREAVRTNISSLANSPQALLDTTAARHALAAHGMDRARSLPSPDAKTNSSFRLSFLLRPLQESLPSTLTRIYNTPEPPKGTEDFTHISKRGSVSFVPLTSSPFPLPPSSGDVADTSPNGLSSDSSLRMHTYPPSTSTGDMNSTSFLAKGLAASAPWNVGVPSWLKVPRKGVGTTSPNSAVPSAFPESQGDEGVREVYESSTPGQASGASTELSYSVLETPEAAVDQEMAGKFKAAFAFDDKEMLLGYFAGYLVRLLPIFGRLYVSSNYFCFKSTGPLSTKTRMILPIRDILTVEMTRATSFGHHGLTVMIKGHEELFFEFGFEDRRRAFVSILERQLEDIRKRPNPSEVPSLSRGKRDALILEEFGPRNSLSSDNDPAPSSEAMSKSVPAVMFTSASSTFLTFTPKESLHFTFLTIGSRGDVQPYIALAKGLMADGHRVKIATHGEFQAWVESHGIEFGYVGGDPAELMRICTENGTCSVSFWREGLLKFRGWLEDLLKTSWEACRGTDVLVESPSAMGGYHIAEALGIPYFRAFTMTWTRTRVYPHAFAVPEHKLGGSYNYMTYVMFDQVFWRAMAGQINRWRRNVLRLDNTSLDRMEPHKIPFLYNFSPTVVPPPLDWPEWIRVTGYWFLDDADVGAKKWTPPQDLLQFIDSAHQAGKKVVYIGFGSIVVPDPKAITRCVVDAVVQSGVYAILSKGWSDRLHTQAAEAPQPEEPFPKQIYTISSIPHDWLFKRIDAACHHGGAGTTGASLRAGIPTIIKPFFGDQLFWADRVEALGIGTAVRKLTADSLSQALTLATTDRKQIERARLIGEKIRSENGVAIAVEAIYRDLDYARSLIRRPSNGPTDLVEGESVTKEEQPSDPSTSTPDRSSPRSRYDSFGSQRGSEDWSVISDSEDRRSSFSSRSNGKMDRSATLKRNNLTAAVISVLPDSLTYSTHRRSSSTSSAQP
ncbi:glycosyltransferase family 1 protein [Butyriboletus roseoflavus]|nr:glycosyltransferase family 1 protein [Butyriboletus roseoflavus]